MKGQASIELLITLGVVLAFTIPVLFLMFTVTSVGYEDTAVAQADASARSLADSINLVYGQGVGAKRVILLNLPAATESISIDDGEVVVSLMTSSGEFDAVAPTFAAVEYVPGPGDDERSGLIAVGIEAFEDSEGAVLVRVDMLE